MNRHWRINHIHKHQPIMLAGAAAHRLQTEQSLQNKSTNFHSNPEVEHVQSYREARRYSTSELECKIRERLVSHIRPEESVFERSPANANSVRLPKLPVLKFQNLSEGKTTKKEFVFNFYRKGRLLGLKQASNRKTE